MKNRHDAIHYCMQYNSVFEDQPFRDKNWTLIRHNENQKVFAWIFEKDSHIWINVKGEPALNHHLRQSYDSIVPAYHLNKEHWNSIILDGTIPEKEIHEMIKTSYHLTKEK
ncbi:MmcQ/YjbR family DNA-binding protein [Priestia endophytica]|uniref:MmcQ/YjbR family DNA-binding protein n=1 Tax=Priestia endophytica TaxID=135735 RepID=UPI00204154FB|nr:MmcQ/YjbR family DNA-binding protein [Priestia endophytica]MCM3537938.1 MmcQ/YjbR family DNA-binding protein [Priestia endophytica]